MSADHSGEFAAPARHAAASGWTRRAAGRVAPQRLFWREPARIALETLWTHKLRSFLTLLGVIISVTTLIGVMSIVDGMNRYVAERVANLGANVFYVTRFPIITNAKDYFEASRRNKQISLEDYEYLRERMTLAEEVGAVEFGSRDARGGRQNLEDVSVRGVTPNMVLVSTDQKVASGRYITEGDMEHRSMVAFIGNDIAEALYANTDPVGKTVYVEGRPFQIVGVGEKVGSTLGQSQDNYICVPLRTYMKVWGSLSPRSGDLNLGIKCMSPDVMNRAMDQARVLMRVRRGLKPDETDAFGIIASDSLTNLWDQIFGGLAAVAVAITSVFLVVGGIVIMNIMLASVTERTHEIGVRKSLGARRRDILMQFLVESSVLSTAGGVIGVLVAVGLTQLVAAVTPVPMHTAPSAVVLPVLMSTAVGLFFGIYPARKAAKLDPIVALRAE
jgi:putative ABC transport system permease protein